MLVKKVQQRKVKTWLKASVLQPVPFVFLFVIYLGLKYTNIGTMLNTQSIFVYLVIMSDFDRFKDNDDDLAVQEAKPKLKRPPLYKVILLNDDFTPMDFVIEILMDFFAMSEQKATQVMLQIHTQGVGICGTYSKDVAETKVYIVNDYSRAHQHPLLCSMEAV